MNSLFCRLSIASIFLSQSTLVETQTFFFEGDVYQVGKLFIIQLLYKPSRIVMKLFMKNNAALPLFHIFSLPFLVPVCVRTTAAGTSSHSAHTNH